MFAKDYRKLAWGKLSENWGTAIVVFLLNALIVGIASSTAVGGLLLSGILGVGLASFYLSLMRSQPFKIETMFDGFRENVVGNLLAGVLVYLFTFLWSLLFVIPGLVKSYSYSMTFYILKDHPEMSATDAITESRKMMNGNKWRLFCLDLSFIGWYLLSILTLGILALWISPYNMMARAEFYESLKPQPAVEDEAFVGGMAEETQNGDTTQL